MCFKYPEMENLYDLPTNMLKQADNDAKSFGWIRLPW